MKAQVIIQVVLVLQIPLTQIQGPVSLVPHALLVRPLFDLAVGTTTLYALEQQVVHQVVNPAITIVHAHNVRMDFMRQMAAATVVIRHSPTAHPAVLTCASAVAMAIVCLVIADLASVATATAQLVVTPVANALQLLMFLAHNVPPLSPIARRVPLLHVQPV
jgi:glycerol-3-phosphate acyltransferase PlsY